MNKSIKDNNQINNQNNIHLNNIDNTNVLNIYSFGIFLNAHLFTYKYILTNNNLFGSALYTVGFNILTKYIFQYSILNLINNNLWIKNFDNVAMPLLLNSIGNIIILNAPIPDIFLNRSFIEFGLLLFLNIFLSNNYPNEKQTSKMFRFNSTIFYFLIYNLL